MSYTEVLRQPQDTSFFWETFFFCYIRAHYCYIIMIIETSTYARAGLLGNPSDGFFGKTISVIIRNFGARVTLYQSPELVIEEQEVDLNKFRNVYHLVDSVNLTGYYGGVRLIKAAIKKFTEKFMEKD